MTPLEIGLAVALFSAVFKILWDKHKIRLSHKDKKISLVARLRTLTRGLVVESKGYQFANAYDRVTSYINDAMQKRTDGSLGSNDSYVPDDCFEEGNKLYNDLSGLLEEICYYFGVEYEFFFELDRLIEEMNIPDDVIIDSDFVDSWTSRMGDSWDSIFDKNKTDKRLSQSEVKDFSAEMMADIHSQVRPQVMKKIDNFSDEAERIIKKLRDKI